VGGTLIAYEGSALGGGYTLHFQNEATGDCYIATTANDSSFGAQLPPGIYDLRAERGAILVHAIIVAAGDRELGQVSDLAPYAPQRIWQFQQIAPAQVTSAAPSTANIHTLDTTRLPASTYVANAPAVDLPSGTPQYSEPVSGWVSIKNQGQAPEPRY
jgi:hypothetical protein